MTSLQNMGYGNETLDMYMPSSSTEGVYTTRVSSDVPCALPPPTRYTLHGRIHACTRKNLCAAKFEASMFPCTSQIVSMSLIRAEGLLDVANCLFHGHVFLRLKAEPDLFMHGRAMT